jgi:hypothetical protein
MVAIQDLIYSPFSSDKRIQRMDEHVTHISMKYARNLSMNSYHGIKPDPLFYASSKHGVSLGVKNI